MDHKHLCVIDDNKIYKTVVLALAVKKTGSQAPEWTVQHYTLQTGDALVDAAVPTMRPYAGAEGLVSPKWEASSWIEAATPDEITAWETEHPAPPAPAPTAQEQLRADVDYIAAMTGVSL